MAKELETIKQLHKKLIASKLHAFPEKGKVVVSSKHGVYVIYDSKKMHVLHVGKTVSGKNGINQRLSNHLGGQSSFSKKYVIPKKIYLRKEAKFRFFEIENARNRSLVEALTAGLLCPSHIGTGVVPPSK